MSTAPAWLSIGVLVATLAAGALPARAETGTGTTLIVATRSIGGRRGAPPDRRRHAALLMQLADGRRFIVQAGPRKVPRLLFDDTRVVGWLIATADPLTDFSRAAGGYWGEPEVRELPITEVTRFALPELGEAELRAAVTALNRELEAFDYRLTPGPSSNSFVSLFLERLRLTPPPLANDTAPGWGWRP